nr:sarcolemmal membrane-associated protein [Ipomoea batatas]
MAGLLAWAADVVGKSGHINGADDDDPNSIPLILTDEQQAYVQELNRKAASLSRAIQDLRLRLPPPDISQRLPHLHAHSLASNAALALQLNAHSATKEQAQQREVTLQEENAEYEKAISNCKNKIVEKLQEADTLQIRLKEMELFEENLRSELESALAAVASQSVKSNKTVSNSTVMVDGGTESSKSTLAEKVEDKKNELASMEELVQDLEKKWAQVQDKALKQPSPAQREKLLDKQLHSLIEQLAAKQAQAEGLANEIHIEEMNLERLKGLQRRSESSSARNRYARSSSFDKGHASSDYIVDPRQKPPYQVAGRTEAIQKLVLLRSGFVLYILALHILVFIKISF